MTRNPLTDGVPPFAPQFNSMSNAHAQEAVLEGLGLSTGSGDWEVEIADGQIVLGDEVIDVDDDVVELSESDDEDRRDLITVDDDGVLDVVEGNPASEEGQPISPDIPEGSVLVGSVYVRGESSEILSGDLEEEARTVVQETSPEMIDPQGEGSGLNADLLQNQTPADLVPSGIITMWSGDISDIPDGWELCDGDNGTPDLTDRFVVGAGDVYSVRDTGGEDEVTLTEDELPSHVHDNEVLRDAGVGGDESISGFVRDDEDEGTWDDSRIDNDAVGGDQAHENRPPFYAVAFIMKT